MSTVYYLFHRLKQPDVLEVTMEDFSNIEYPSWRVDTWGWTVGKRLPASSVNFYFANKTVVVTQCNQPKWNKAA